MQAVRWDLLPGVIYQLIINISLLTLALTFFGTFLLKFFVRQVPLLSHAFIFFWAVFRVLFVTTVLWLGVVITGLQIPAAFSGLFSIAGMCVVGWLITRSLETGYGVPKKFPGAGFKVMLSLLALSWIFVGAYWIFAR